MFPLPFYYFFVASIKERCSHTREDYFGRTFVLLRLDHVMHFPTELSLSSKKHKNILHIQSDMSFTMSSCVPLQDHLKSINVLPSPVLLQEILSQSVRFLFLLSKIFYSNVGSCNISTSSDDTPLYTSLRKIFANSNTAYLIFGIPPSLTC